jgi:hypothetical protein
MLKLIIQKNDGINKKMKKVFFISLENFYHLTTNQLFLRSFVITNKTYSITEITIKIRLLQNIKIYSKNTSKIEGDKNKFI